MNRSTLILSITLIAGAIVIMFPKSETETHKNPDSAKNRRTVFGPGQEIEEDQNRSHRRARRRTTRPWSSARAEDILTSLQELASHDAYTFFYGEEESFNHLTDLNQGDIAYLLDHTETIDDESVRNHLNTFVAQRYQLETYQWLKSPTPFVVDEDGHGDIYQLFEHFQKLEIKKLLTQSQKDFTQSTTQEISEWLFEENELNTSTRAGRLASFSQGIGTYLPGSTFKKPISPVKLVSAPETAEFGSFINYGSPIELSANGEPTTVIITESRIEMPIFSSFLTPEIAIKRAQELLLKEDSPEWLHQLIEHEIAQLREAMEPQK